MKKIQLMIILLVFLGTNVFAQGSNPAMTKMVAMGIAALIFFGIVSIIKGLKKDKEK